MKISIVTTCLNRADKVADAIESIKRQDYEVVEHIVVDGASTDGSVEVIKKCNSPRIAKLISEKDKGAYSALNKGIRMATGDIVGWLHSDDILADDHVLSRVAETFRLTGCDMIYGNGLFIDDKNEKWVVRDWVSGSYKKSKLFRGWLPLHTTVFVKRELFEKFGYYREDYRIASDTDWMLRVMIHPEQVKIVYVNLYFVIMRCGGLSTDVGRMLYKWREDLGCYKNSHMPPYKTLFLKVMRKIPQFIKAPFVRMPYGYARHFLAEQPRNLIDALPKDSVGPNSVCDIM